MMYENNPINKEHWYETVTHRRRTPIGTIFVSIMEKEGLPVQVIINAGKTGSEFSAYCDSIGRLITQLIKHAGPVEAFNIILSELSNITTDRAISNPNGVACRSGAEGIYLALLDYRRDKQSEEETIDYRPSTIRYRV